ncbi:MAG: Tm-1-like ATP-binding domain-containing protein [Verrucomicrobiota bacterium]|nr:Tm-1-like ATP-binding domain-containing protein [Verrucomicrobiota bacterium]
MATIAILGTLDSKGEEHAFVAQQIQQRGHKTLIIDVGTLGQPKLKPDIRREEVLAAAGFQPAKILQKKDRGQAVSAMSQGAPIVLAKLAASKKIGGVISIGGGGGTAIATAAMRALPIGFPKIMISTLASGNTAQYVGVKDIVMFPSIVDVSGLNRISRQIFTQAAGAICGMVEVGRQGRTSSPQNTFKRQSDKPIIVASMFGNTTECVQRAQKILEQAGYEILVFHATGIGGRTMESLIETGLVAGVLDITITEWADELVGGVLSAGPTRLEAAAKNGVPAIVVPGCLDMVNFHAPETVPAKFKGRNFYAHNPQVTLMRTTLQENARLGKIIAEKLNCSIGPLSVLLPLQGLSIISAPGQKFYDAAADHALFASLKKKLRKTIEVIEMNCAINDAAFAETCAQTLLKNIGLHVPQRPNQK